MKFKWNMKESEWKRMIDEHINHKDSSDNVYGNLYVGKLCIDFVHTKDDDAWYLFPEVFELGKDTGYGYTPSNVPYDYLDSDFKIPVRCKTFDSFKAKVEKLVKDMVVRDNLIEQAEAELADWN